jgi:hypothetical protein
MLALPTTTAPARRQRVTILASRVARKPRIVSEPAVVCIRSAVA